MAYNASSTVAALTVITSRLLQLPANYGTEEQRTYWQALSKRIPPISYTQFNGHTTIAPAQSWERVNNAGHTKKRKSAFSAVVVAFRIELRCARAWRMINCAWVGAL